MQGAGREAPTDADPKGEWYAFEKGAMKTGGGDGWADVWKRGCFAWEYKSPGKDLGAALKQLQYYVRSLENPPLLIVSDMERIELHTNWTNTVQDVHTLALPELADARRRQRQRRPRSRKLKPGKTREALTKEVAEESSSWRRPCASGGKSQRIEYKHLDASFSLCTMGHDEGWGAICWHRWSGTRPA